MDKTNKPSVIKAILLSILVLLIFYFLCTAIGVFLILLYALLKMIPVVGELLDAFFAARGDGPELAIPCIYLVFSYFISISLTERISKHIPTRNLTLKLLGFYLIVLNIIFLVLNIVSNSPWGLNIGYIIAGIAFYIKSSKAVAFTSTVR